MEGENHAAIRVAAQTIMALRAGARVKYASIEDGIELTWPTVGASEWDHDRETAARIDILLAGIAALLRYTFGLPPDESAALLLEPRSDDPVSLDDLACAEALTRQLGHRAASTFEGRKRQMASLIYEPLFWRRIEQLADALLCGPQNRYRLASHGDFSATAVQAITRGELRCQIHLSDARSHDSRPFGPCAIDLPRFPKRDGFSSAKMRCRNLR